MPVLCGIWQTNSAQRVMVGNNDSHPTRGSVLSLVQLNPPKLYWTFMQCATLARWTISFIPLFPLFENSFRMLWLNFFHLSNELQTITLTTMKTNCYALIASSTPQPAMPTKRKHADKKTNHQNYAKIVPTKLNVSFQAQSFAPLRTQGHHCLFVILLVSPLYRLI